MPFIPQPVLDRIFEAHDREVTDLRRRLDAKHDHERRVERVDAGLPELPAKPPEPIGPMPKVLMDYLAEIPHGPVRDDQQRAFIELRRKYGSWDGALEVIRAEVELPGEVRDRG